MALGAPRRVDEVEVIVPRAERSKRQCPGMPSINLDGGDFEIAAGSRHCPVGVGEVDRFAPGGEPALDDRLVGVDPGGVVDLRDQAVRRTPSVPPLESAYEAVVQHDDLRIPRSDFELELRPEPAFDTDIAAGVDAVDVASVLGEVVDIGGSKPSDHCRRQLTICEPTKLGGDVDRDQRPAQVVLIAAAAVRETRPSGEGRSASETICVAASFDATRALFLLRLHGEPPHSTANNEYGARSEVGSRGESQ